MIQDCLVAVTACGGDARVPKCIGADSAVMQRRLSDLNQQKIISGSTWCLAFGRRAAA